MEDKRFKDAAAESLRHTRQLLDQELEELEIPVSERLVKFLSSLRIEFSYREYEFFKQKRISDNSKKCVEFVRQIKLFLDANNDRFPLICQYLNTRADFLEKIITYRAEKMSKTIPYSEIITNSQDIFVNSEFLYIIYQLSPNLPEQLDNKTARLLSSIIKFIDQAGKNIPQSIDELLQKINEWLEIKQTLGRGTGNSQLIIQLEEIIDRINRELRQIKESGDISEEALNSWTQSSYLSSIISDLAVFFNCEYPLCSNYGKMNILFNCGETNGLHKCTTKYCCLKCKKDDRKRHKFECVGGIKTKKDRDSQLKEQKHQGDDPEQEAILTDESLNYRKIIEKYRQQRMERERRMEDFASKNEERTRMSREIETMSMEDSRARKYSGPKRAEDLHAEHLEFMKLLKDQHENSKQQRESSRLQLEARHSKLQERINELSENHRKLDETTKQQLESIETKVNTILHGSKRKGGTKKRKRTRRYLKTIWY